MEKRVKKACCALAETIHGNEKGGVKTSEKVGDYSVGYAVGTQRTDVQKLDDTIQLYLDVPVPNKLPDVLEQLKNKEK